MCVCVGQLCVCVGMVYSPCILTSHSLHYVLSALTLCLLPPVYRYIKLQGPEMWVYLLLYQTDLMLLLVTKFKPRTQETQSNIGNSLYVYIEKETPAIRQ